LAFERAAAQAILSEDREGFFFPAFVIQFGTKTLRVTGESRRRLLEIKSIETGKL